MLNLPALAKKGSVSRTTKPKSIKRGDDSSKTCFDIVPYEGGLPPIGNIVLESSSLPSARTHSSRHSIASKRKPSIPRLTIDAPPSSRTHGSKRKTSLPPHLPLPRGEYIISKLHLFIYFTYLWGFPVANSTCILIHLSPFIFFSSLAV